MNGPSVKLNQNTLWIVGGRNKHNDLKSTEFLFLDQPPIRGPDLPFNVSCHCLVRYDSNSIYLIGGFQNGKRSEQVWIINPLEDFSIREAPSMKAARTLHSCGKMEINGKVALIVAGGYNGSSSVWGKNYIFIS